MLSTITGETWRPDERGQVHDLETRREGLPSEGRSQAWQPADDKTDATIMRFCPPMNNGARVYFHFIFHHWEWNGRLGSRGVAPRCQFAPSIRAAIIAPNGITLETAGRCRNSPAGRPRYLGGSVLAPWSRHGVAPALLRRCSGGASLLFPCTSLVQPLYIPYTSLVLINRVRAFEFAAARAAGPIWSLLQVNQARR